MKPAELNEVLRVLQIDDSHVQKMCEKLQDASIELSVLTAQDTPEKDARLKEIRARKDAIEKIMSDWYKTVVTNQEGLLRIERETLDSLEVRFREALARQQEDKSKTAKYIEAKTHYLQTKRIFETAQVKYSEMMFERMR